MKFSRSEQQLKKRMLRHLTGKKKMEDINDATKIKANIQADKFIYYRRRKRKVRRWKGIEQLRREFQWR